MTPRLALAALAALAALVLTAAPAGAARLDGRFVLDSGRSTGNGATGSWFRMAFPGNGRRFFRNPDSRARDKTYTLLRTGRTGLVTGRYQADRRFDRRGNSRARAITRPVRFAGVRFGLATFPVDPQSRRSVPAPAFTNRGRRLFANLASLTAAWNRLLFNQGQPKPGASVPSVRGSYNPRTRRFAIRWRSRIRGGPFNGFTGVWRLSGRFVPR